MKTQILVVGFCAAGLALSACDPATNGVKADANNTRGEEKAWNDLLDLKNIQPLDISYGDLPSKPGPSGFTATYDALVYFGIDTDAKLISTIRYFDAAGNDYPAIKQQMLACIARLDANLADRCEGQLKQVSLDDLTFKAPTNVVFAARNASLKFATEPLVFSKSLDKDHPNYPDGKKAKPNKSFYNARVIPEGTRQLVYVANYYSKKRGSNANGSGPGDTPIGANENYWYGMNLFMTIDQVGGDPVRIIIDPDGGNMSSGNP
jgi:hypothetical protein